MIPTTIQAIRVHRFGGPEELRLEEVPCPVPQAGELLVRVHTAGVLPAEWKMRQGLFTWMPISFPYIPGSAFAGVVAAVGPGVTTFQPGQPVFGRSNKGSYADYAIASVETTAAKPAALSFDEAATISGGATVAWTALFDNGALQPGQQVLIHGAAGGVGLFAVQFARLHGAQITATASTASVEFVRSLGAETVIDYTATPFEAVVHEVDLVLDTIGGETLERSFQVVRPGGTLVSLLGEPPQEPARRLGIRAIANSVVQPFPATSLLQTIAQLMANGEVKTVVGQSFSLPEVQQAHRLSQQGHGRGRIVLHVT